jgi:hypothetical protein
MGSLVFMVSYFERICEWVSTVAGFARIQATRSAEAAQRQDHQKGERDPTDHSLHNRPC